MAQKKAKSNKTNVGILRGEQKIRKLIIGGATAILILVVGIVGYSVVKGTVLKAQAERWTELGRGYSGGTWDARACKTYETPDRWFAVRLIVYKYGWSPTNVYVNTGSQNLVWTHWNPGPWYWYQQVDFWQNSGYASYIQVRAGNGGTPWQAWSLLTKPLNQLSWC